VRWRALCATLAVLLIAGCGAATRERTAPASTPVAQAQRTHEYPAQTASPPQQAADPGTSATDAIRAFATVYINWTPATVATQMEQLAARSVGQARAAMQLAAAETAHDYELQQGGISNSGAVEAISPLPSAGDRYIVVTRESTTATNTTAYQGLRPAWHVAIATVARLQGGWVVSGWQPES
jgi:hypothetical protein